MRKVTFDYSKALDFLNNDELITLQSKISLAHEILHNKTGKGNDYLGWLDLPDTYDKDEFKRIQSSAQKIRDDSDIFLIVGIGGSYLGARAAIEMLNHGFYNILPKESRKGPEIHFMGHNMSAKYFEDFLDLLDGKDISLNVISKSGTTTEPAIAFRILKDYMEKRYGKKGASKRIYITTDGERGALKTMASYEGYKTFVIPDDVGGRYSVLTAVGLLPIAVGGIDIKAIMDGAYNAYLDLKEVQLDVNHSYQYGALRNIFYKRGKLIEILVQYEPSLFYMGEWWKQLFGESEGKDFRGIFPATVNFSTDLHSMGQYIQEGRRHIFETTLHIENTETKICVPKNEDNLDGLNYLAGKTIDHINKNIFQAALMAHSDGGVPNLIINIPRANPYYFGYLVYFLQKSCAISAYLLGVNPFNQPGVEAYKTNLFRLLEKPDYIKKGWEKGKI